MARDVICISYASGAGGEEIGRLVADRLGFLYVDEDIVLAAAARGGVDPERVAEEERRKPMFAGLLEYMSAGAAAQLPTPPPIDTTDSEAVRAFIRDAITEVAERGGAVIAAHAASFAVSPERRPLRVLVTAPADTRADRVASAEHLEPRDAAKAIKRSDAGRADYLKRFYGVADERPTHYDLVVNTAELPLESAAALIVEASRAHSAGVA
jgi:Cytidylate kinase-like family